MSLTARQPQADGQPRTGTGRPVDSARVVVVGLGFAGLPTAVVIAAAGFETIGLDIDAAKVASINVGRGASGVDSTAVAPLVRERLLSATTDPSILTAADVIVISVPTPIDQEGLPDDRALSAACRTVLEHVSANALIVLQSTVVPGTTRRLLTDPLQRSGRSVGNDIFVGYSPERINPGDAVYRVSNTTKVVAGATDACTQRTAEFVGAFVDSVAVAASLETAELSKLVENTFRFINISFVNELAILCDRLGVSIWNVIDSAATKPFAFMPHYPGPGIGGDCIPVSPRYLAAAAAAHGLTSELVRAGFQASGAMPDFVVDRCARELGCDPRDLTGMRITVVGLAYKPDVADTRHSPAIPVIRALRDRGASINVLDPVAGTIVVDGVRYASGDPDATWPEGPMGADAAIVVTPHRAIDYAQLAASVGVVLDTRNAVPASPSGRVVSL